MHCFYIAIVPYIPIVGDLAPQVDLMSSIEMTPLIPTQHPYIRDLMVSIKVLGKLVVEPKTLGWEHSPERFRKPWSSIHFTEMFSNWFWTNGVGHGGRGSWWFYKKALVFLCSRSEQLTCATTLPRYGTGPSVKFVCFSAGCLILYKGSWYLENMVHATLESGLSPRMGQYISRHIPSRRKTLGFSRRGARVTL
jgi:hypothetical protein